MFLVIRRAWCADQTVLCLVRNIGIACVSRLFYFEPSRSYQNVLPREKKSFIRKTVTTLSQTMILPMNILTSVVDPDLKTIKNCFSSKLTEPWIRIQIEPKFRIRIQINEF